VILVLLINCVRNVLLVLNLVKVIVLIDVLGILLNLGVFVLILNIITHQIHLELQKIWLIQILIMLNYKAEVGVIKNNKIIHLMEFQLIIWFLLVVMV